MAAEIINLNSSPAGTYAEYSGQYIQHHTSMSVILLEETIYVQMCWNVLYQEQKGGAEFSQICVSLI